MTLRLVLPDFDVEALIELDQGNAPFTSAALTALLPSRGLLLHSRRSGQEIFAVLPHTELTDGISVTTLTPGDVIVDTLPAHYHDAPPPRIHDRSQPYTHLGIVYGPETRYATPAGYVPVRRIGRVTVGLEALAIACIEIRLNGIRAYELDQPF